MWCRIMTSLASQRKWIEIPAMVLMPYIWTSFWKCGWLIPNLFSLRCPCLYVVEGFCNIDKKNQFPPHVFWRWMCACVHNSLIGDFRRRRVALLVATRLVFLSFFFTGSYNSKSYWSWLPTNIYCMHVTIWGTFFFYQGGCIVYIRNRLKIEQCC